MISNKELFCIVGDRESIDFSSNKVRIMDTNLKTIVWQESFPSSVNDLFVNGRFLCIVTAANAYLYTLDNLVLLRKIESTRTENFICVMSAFVSPTFLAVYSGEKPGSVQILNASNLTLEKPVNAHKAPLRSICFAQQFKVEDYECTLMATASQKGTLIRIFAIPSAERVYTLRMGMWRRDILMMNFSWNSKYIGVVSSSSSIHIFHLQDLVGGLSALSGLMKTSQNYKETKKNWDSEYTLTFQSSEIAKRTVEDNVSDVLQYPRSFTKVNVENIKILDLMIKENRLYLVTGTGILLEYDVQADVCHLERSSDLVSTAKKSMLSPIVRYEREIESSG